MEQTYRYLDTEADRRELLDELREVRQAVIATARSVPEDQWYTPRYHDWSLAAMLGHLMLMDTVNLWWIQLALLKISPRPPASLLDQFNALMAQVFQKRVIETTIMDIERKEKKVDEFILNLPIERFTNLVCYPTTGEMLTVERAVQTLFLHHWQEHLKTMLDVEGIENPRDTSAG
jgi:hypothetical protein